MLILILAVIACTTTNCVVRNQAIGYPVLKWLTWFDPKTIALYMATISATFADMGFRQGGVIRFWINAYQGLKLTDLHHVWASTTGLLGAFKALFRWKALLTALYLHITPDVMSTGTLFGTRFSLAHPAMTAYRDMLAREPIRFAQEICDDCILVVPCSLAPSIVSYALNITGGMTEYKRGKTLNVAEDHYVPQPSNFVYPQEDLSSIQLPLPPTKSLLSGYFLHDERLQLFTKIGQSLYNTTFGAVRGSHWWALGDSTTDMGASYWDFIAAGYANALPDLQKEPSNPCKMGFDSPMDDIIHMYHELALRVSVITAIDSNTTQSLP
ncbi:hypothetical protein B0H65DRAFT_574815 [Neurospora tetraspora]|uniref:Uncharacterized protein n=1 Tax=Neurospora tetraspora TaxID=94610 RepID=A0AAE0JH89_9PEZI|nr:hypothetical protein B0H65DRAFT_574815 [Neurospora tetraspora]